MASDATALPPLHELDPDKLLRAPASTSVYGGRMYRGADRYERKFDEASHAEGFASLLWEDDGAPDFGGFVWCDPEFGPFDLHAGLTHDGFGNLEYQVYMREMVQRDEGMRTLTIRFDRLTPEERAEILELCSAHGIGWDGWAYKSGKIVHSGIGGTPRGGMGEGFALGELEVDCENPGNLPFGTWPAIWMLGRGPWPTAGEIDLMEKLPMDPERQLSWAVHYGPSPDQRQYVVHHRSSSGLGPNTRHRLVVRRVAPNVTRLDMYVTPIGYSRSKQAWVETGEAQFMRTVDLSKFVDRDGVVRNVSGIFEGPFDIILNVAVGGHAMCTTVRGTKLCSDPAIFDPGRLLPGFPGEWKIYDIRYRQSMR